MIDAVHDDEQVTLVDFVDDAVGPASCTAHCGEFPLEGAAYAVRVVKQCSEHELNDGCGGPFREATKLTFGRRGYLQIVRGACVAHFFKYRDRSSLPVM